MARTFETGEAKRILERHRHLLDVLIVTANMERQLRGEVWQASENMRSQSAQLVLRDIPVEELNRDKSGIRVKTLRDAGYQNLAEIMGATNYQLESINGISREGAAAIKQAAANIAGQAQSGTKIRLSLDQQTPQSTALVYAIAKHRIATNLTSQANALLANQQTITMAMTDLDRANGSLKWIFASGSNKERASQAYNYLVGLLNGAYGQQTTQVETTMLQMQAGSPAEAWQAFANDSIGFLNDLEAINPGVLGNDDSLYGLPEDLAQEISQQEIFPDGLNCTLRRYQEWGVKYILHQERVLLGDEMGLGKTVQAIATMVSLCNTGASHFVVVCPASVLTNWCREISKMSKLSVTKVYGSSRESALHHWMEKGGVAVTTYETTANWQLPEDYKFSLMVVDEAHYIKNPEAQRTLHVRALSLHAQRLLFMTGTALENKVDEMVELIRVLQPQLAGQSANMASLSSAPQFRELVAPVYYRRKREEVLTELPDLIEKREWCDLLPEEEKVYEDAVLQGEFAKARQVSWSVGDLENSSKARRLRELVGYAKADGRKLIVFSYFLDTITKIQAFLGDCCTPIINGSVSPQRRQEIIDEFDKAPAGTVLVAQILAGGTGLNIQSASVVILCEPQFKPSIENQAIARAYRMGQSRSVFVHRLLCDDTVDEKILDILSQKQEVFDAFADSSVAADQSREVDETSFGNIIQEEIDRIKAKQEVASTDGATASKEQETVPTNETTLAQENATASTPLAEADTMNSKNLAQTSTQI